LMAAQEGRGQIVKLLLAAGADVEKSLTGGLTPLMVAAEYGHASAVKALLEANADLSITIEYNGKDYTALDLAKANRHLGVVALLKKYGAVDFDLGF
jgi:ankyrin repeat protein